MDKIKIVFLIRSLNVGGAERQLVELVRHLDKKQFEITVITFYDGGNLRPDLESLPMTAVYSLGKRGRYDWARPLVRFYRLIKKIRPQIIHGYMGVANELALITARLSGAKAVLGIRASNKSAVKYDWLSQFMFQVGRSLSRWADLVIFNSATGRDYYLSRGYATHNTLVIHNGVDIHKFLPDAAAGRPVRQAWGVKDDEHLIGIVGRLHPIKGHELFLQAAALMLKDEAALRFVCVGGGSTNRKEALRQLAEELGIAKQIIWAGARADMPAVYNALDLLLSTSLSEGFPNVVGEAMACGIPCIVTDVGDAAYLVQDPQMVVPSGDTAALAQASLKLLNHDRLDVLKQQVCERIQQCFTGAKLAEKTADSLTKLIQ